MRFQRHELVSKLPAANYVHPLVVKIMAGRTTLNLLWPKIKIARAALAANGLFEYLALQAKPHPTLQARNTKASKYSCLHGMSTRAPSFVFSFGAIPL